MQGFKKGVRYHNIFIVVIAAAALLQFLYPDILLTGVAIAISILLMYFTMQNPESMLDNVSEVFNYSALMIHLHTQISECREMWLIAAISAVSGE